jgi:hypothetical protein
MFLCLVNIEFEDKYTGDKYVAGKTYPFSKERIAEVQEVNKNFITVLSEVKDEPTIEEVVEPPKPNKPKTTKKATK